VIYDGLFVPGGKESVDEHQDDTDALMFVAEVFKHSKTIGASGEGVDLLVAATPPGRSAKNGKDGEATLLAMDGIIGQRKGASIADAAQAFIDALAQHRHFSREPALKGG